MSIQASYTFESRKVRSGWASLLCFRYTVPQSQCLRHFPSHPLTIVSFFQHVWCESECIMFVLYVMAHMWCSTIRMWTTVALPANFISIFFINRLSRMYEHIWTRKGKNVNEKHTIWHNSNSKWVVNNSFMFSIHDNMYVVGLKSARLNISSETNIALEWFGWMYRA